MIHANHASNFTAKIDKTKAKVAKAQEELRAVLSVRQEAIAVMFGLLP